MPIASDASSGLPEPGTPAFKPHEISAEATERALLIVLHLPMELAESHAEIYRSLASAVIEQGRVVPFPAGMGETLMRATPLIVGFGRATSEHLLRVLRAIEHEFGDLAIPQAWWSHLASTLHTLRTLADASSLEARAQMDQHLGQIGLVPSASSRMAARRGLVAITADAFYPDEPSETNLHGLPGFVRSLPIPTAHVLVRLDPAAGEERPHRLPGSPDAQWTSEIWLASEEGANEIIGGLLDEILAAAHVPANADRRFIDALVATCRSDSA